MKYALDSVFYSGRNCVILLGFGISECMGMYPFILREDLDLMGSERKIDPRFGFTVFFWARWRKEIVMITLSLDVFWHLFCLPPSSFSQICWIKHPGGQTVSLETFYGDNNLLRSALHLPRSMLRNMSGRRAADPSYFALGGLLIYRGNPPRMSGQRIRI